MRDNDTIILENLYVSILEEDAASSKAQALNFFVQNEVGREIFKYKNKPENKEIIDKAKIIRYLVTDLEIERVKHPSPSKKPRTK